VRSGPLRRKQDAGAYRAVRVVNHDADDSGPPA
jgi:hypothetical protein